MDNPNIAAIVIWLLAVLGCGILFFGIGIWAERSEKPVHFWSGTKVDPRKVKDIPAYNHANARMWKFYSLPYMVSGALGGFSFWGEWLMSAGVAILLSACFPGVIFLIRRYRQIEKEFILP